MKLFFWYNVAINVAINMINNNRNCKNRTFSEFLLFKQHSHSYQTYQFLYQILYQSLLFHMQSAAHEGVSTLLAQYIHLLQHVKTTVSQIDHTDSEQWLHTESHQSCCRLVIQSSSSTGFMIWEQKMWAQWN